MKIFVASCDKNEDTFEPFHHCIEKYWKNHPKVFYATETIKNSYYKTISINIPFEKWTKRIRESLQQIDDEQILFMIDDCFIRQQVDTKRIEYACKNLKGNIAMFNFEKSFDENDEDTSLINFKKRKHGSPYEVSLLCGLWQKDKLIKILEEDSDCWSVEYKQKNYGFDFFINSGDFIIDWGYKTWKPSGIFKGLWCREVVDFFEKEGIKVDYFKRGFAD